MFKLDLRKDYKNRRKLVSEEQLLNWSHDVAEACLKLPLWHYKYFHLFLPITSKKEIDTYPIISLLRQNDKFIVVPKVADDLSLEHYLLTQTTKILTNRWDIPEPLDGVRVAARKIDVVFLPLLAFDNRGNRVGYGKGFYDNFLLKCRQDVVKIGLSLFEAVEIIEDLNDHDVPMNYCITPKKTYSFSDSDSEV